jgi:hypothetical protein
MRNFKTKDSKQRGSKQKNSKNKSPVKKTKKIIKQVLTLMLIIRVGRKIITIFMERNNEQNL